MALGLPPRTPYEPSAADAEGAAKVTTVTVAELRAMIATAPTRVRALQAITHLLPMRWANVIDGRQYADLLTEALAKVRELPESADDMTLGALQSTKKKRLPSLEERMRGDEPKAKQAPTTKADRLAAYRQAKEEAKTQLGLFKHHGA